ncbi:translocation/assembly module TamB [Vibrio sp.]|nr:translocation/assembly module TamB [Vibrio sp.]
MITRLFTLGKWLFVSVVILIVLMVVSVTALLYSTAGLNIALWGAEKALPSLSVARSEGTLGKSFTLHNIAFIDKTNHIDLSAESLSIYLEATCLFRPAICINQIKGQGIKFAMQTSESPADSKEDATENSQVSSPLPIDIKSAQLNDIDISIDDTKIKWQSLSTGLAWRGVNFRLSPTDWQGIDVSLPVTEKNTQGQAVSAKSSDTVIEGVKLPDITLPLNMTLPRLTVSDLVIQQGESQNKINRIDLSVNTQNSSVNVDKLSLVTPQAEASLSGKANLIGDYPLNFDVSAKYLQAPIKGQSADVEISGSLADLLVKLDAKGALETQLQASLSLVKDNLPFDIQAKNTHGSWPIENQPQYWLDVSQLQASGDLKSYSFSLQADTKAQDMADLSAVMKGNGTLSSVSIEQLLIKTLDGSISGKLTANWEQDVKVNSELVIDKLKPEAFVKNTPGVINGQINTNATILSSGAWKANVTKLDVKGSIKGYPLVVKGEVSANSTTKGLGVEISTPKLVVSHGPNRVVLDGKLAEKWNLNANINIPDLSKTLAQSTGQVTGNVVLTGSQENPKANLKLSGRNIRWKDLFKAESVSLTGAVSSLTSPAGQVDLTLSQGAFQDQRFNSLNVNVDGGVSSHRLTLNIDSPQLDGKASLQGSLDKAYSNWKGQITDVQLSHESKQLSLLKPIDIKANISKGSASIGPHCWGGDDASLCLVKQAQVSANEVTASLSLKALSLDSITGWIPDSPVTAKGVINGSSSVVWKKGKDADINADLTVSQGEIKTVGDGAVTLGWDDISLKALLKKGKLDAQLNANLTDNGDISLNTIIPDVKAENKKLQGNLNLSKINIDFLKPLLGEYSQASALINSDIKLSGELLHPEANGAVTISDIHASGELFPIEVNKGDIKLNLMGYDAKLTALINTPDGDLSIDGDANWDDLANWTVNSHVYADGLNVDVPPMVKIQVIPDINLHMKPSLAQIDGTVKIPKGIIEVEELPESAVEVSKDQVIVDAKGDPVAEQVMPFKVDTNIEVQLGDELRLSAFGLKGRLQGLLKIAQKDNAPFVTGDVNILNGTYRSFGQDLVIQQGKVMMNGSVNKPYVNITAIRNPDNIEDDVTAGIKVSGPADNPSVTVFSDPSMAQANALSYLLRGQDLDTEGGDNSMTTALIGLSLAQSGHIVGELGQAVGVQDLQLDTTGSGDDSQVTVSGYVLPGLQVKYGVGIFNSVGEFTLRYRLVKNLYVEAVSGLTSAVDLLYQFEFD